MSKRGENIYKRKDGRWEGRYIKERSADGKARYAYVYGKSYADAKQKLLDRRITQAQNIDCSPSHTKYGDILRNWIAMSRVHIKESTYSRYIHLANAHILPYLGELPTGKLTTQTVEKHISFLLNKGRVDKKGGLAPKTVSDILTLIKGSIDYQWLDYELPSGRGGTLANGLQDAGVQTLCESYAAPCKVHIVGKV